MSLDLSGKVAIITGASAGIGRGIAEVFSNLGAKLVLVGRNEANINETASLCKKTAKSDILAVVGDVNDPAFCKRIVDETIAKFGKISVLVNNAGIYKMGGIEALDIADYDRIMNTNVRSVIILTQLCIPHLIKEKGSIINNSSINGTRCFPNTIAYSLSKAALDHFTRNVALELADRGVRCNSVNPGVINTEIVKTSGFSEEQFQEFLANAGRWHAMGRIGTVDEVANVIAFLASSASAYVTGEIIHVDGGRHTMSSK